MGWKYLTQNLTGYVIHKIDGDIWKDFESFKEKHTCAHMLFRKEMVT